ncbi:MAG: hypothetical protein QOI76_1207, partial [Frankiales bacterium]|nr:hypothetical protein [Frankiales bacterium]
MDQVATCLDALAAGTVVPGVVHVLSNEDIDTPGSGWDALPARFDGLQVVVARSAVNLGFAGGHNAVLSTLFADSTWDAVVVLNPDVALAPEAA